MVALAFDVAARRPCSCVCARLAVARAGKGLPDLRLLAIVGSAWSPRLRRQYAAGKLERLFAPLTRFLSDLSLAGGDTDKVDPAAPGLATKGPARRPDH